MKDPEEKFLSSREMLDYLRSQPCSLFSVGELMLIMQDPQLSTYSEIRRLYRRTLAKQLPDVL